MIVKHQIEVNGQKARGAFFTPPAIADYLAGWAIGSNAEARVLDPTCGEAVFLQSAGRHLRGLGRSVEDLQTQLFGVDLHGPSLARSRDLLAADGLDAHLIQGDFFHVASPLEVGAPFAEMDAVVGNPPFVRYQLHGGAVRQRSVEMALAQGVRLSGLASSWAALAVHACAFLKPEGRLAMVFPAELLTVHYAEPIRQWLRRRFGAVHLVLFERLQFQDALEKVVLVLASGSGGCDAFSLHHVEDAQQLDPMTTFTEYSVAPSASGKWTDLLLPARDRDLFRQVLRDHFVTLAEFGSPELGTVTGANDYFTLSESRRKEHGLRTQLLTAIAPPGTRHIKGASFTKADWARLRDGDERVWMLQPKPTSSSRALHDYVKMGEEAGVNSAYKCSIRDPWWIPPYVAPPDLFFTYMSHRFPRLINNSARVSFVNSMHGVRLRKGAKRLRAPLSLLTLNSVTMLGAEVFGRSYGGGILKMEPTEAASLPVPNRRCLDEAWSLLRTKQKRLESSLRQGDWQEVTATVDSVLLEEVMRLSAEQTTILRSALAILRRHRLG